MDILCPVVMTLVSGKDDVMKRINELEAANKAAEYEFKRVKAENDVLTKEIGRLRHLEQLRTVPQQVQPVIAKFHYTDPTGTGHGQKSAHLVEYELNSTTRTRTRTRHGPDTDRTRTKSAHVVGSVSGPCSGI